MLEIGSVIDGKYKILNKVGQGGMSVVYLAMNEKANKQWAVKEVRKDGVLDFESVKQGLVAETDILKKLNHKHLPSIIDVIDTDDSFIIIMDYIQGNALDKALKEYGAQPQEYVIEWAKQLCDVLGYLHTRNPAIIYRDMKPANVMLKPDGTITLVDFGTAREFKEKNLADTTCLGTVGYAAPEQFGGMGQTDARTDIYCLGATLYHLVTGISPCEPPYKIQPIRDINPSLSSGLEKIILKCTQPDPNDRYQSAAELMYALEHYEEIDDSFRNAQKKKFGMFLASSILTVVFSLTSVFGYVTAENARSNNYDVILSSADRPEDFFDAIMTDTSRTDAYIGSGDFDGLVQYLIKDGELDSKDNSLLAKLKAGIDHTDSRGYSSTVDVLEKLKKSNPKGYIEVCYEIGEAYLFYYNVGVEKDKYASASSWFQYAVDDFPLASISCDISDCLSNIAKFSKGVQYANLYKEYEKLWTKVKNLQKNADSYEDDLKLHIWNEIVSIISNNTTAFCEVTSKAEIEKVLNSINASSKKITNSFLKENINTLQNNIETTIAKINSVQLDNSDKGGNQ